MVFVLEQPGIKWEVYTIYWYQLHPPHNPTFSADHMTFSQSNPVD